MKTSVLEFFDFLRKANSIGVKSTLKLVFLNLARIEKTLRVNVAGTEVYLRSLTPDWNVASSSLTKEFEPLRYLLPSDFNGLIVDAGGYIGTAAIKLGQMYPHATIVTIEPSSENYRILLLNTEDYQNIKPLNCALVASDAGEVKLSSRGTGPWGYTVMEQSEDQSKMNSVEMVQATTLADILRLFDDSEIGLLKLDIEGGEKSIFDSCSAILKDIDVVLAELHDRIVGGCTASYTEFSINRWSLQAGGEKYISLKKDCAAC